MKIGTSEAMIGFPRESTPGDWRTLLTPTVARALAEAGFTVIAEPGIATGIGCSDAVLQGKASGSPTRAACGLRPWCCVLGELSVLFQPHRITCVLVLAESHIIVSTWPEHKLAHIDLFTCRTDTDHALEPIIDILGSTKAHNQSIKRVTPFSLPVKTVPK